MGHMQGFRKTIHVWVTDVGMSLFFLLAGKEVFESFLPGGSLSSLRKAATPLVATLGGMIFPAAVFYGCCMVFDRQDVLRGWAIPCATDIAFSYLIAKIIFGPNHVAIPFLLLIAMCIGLLLRVCSVKSFLPYLIGPGVCSWLAFEAGGLHPALGLVPIVCLMPHERKDIGIFVEAEDALPDALNRMEHCLKPLVEGILGLFALVNAGVVFSNVAAPTGFVLGSLLVGKPLGIFLCTIVAMAIFSLEMPHGMTKRDLLVVGMVAGIGFTVSLFVSVVAFPEGGVVLDAAKMGALFSFGSGLVAIATAKLLGVQREKSPDRVSVPILLAEVEG